MSSEDDSDRGYDSEEYEDICDMDPETFCEVFNDLKEGYTFPHLAEPLRMSAPPQGFSPFIKARRAATFAATGRFPDMTEKKVRIDLSKYSPEHPDCPGKSIHVLII